MLFAGTSSQALANLVGNRYNLTMTDRYLIFVVDDLRTPLPGSEDGTIVVELHRSLADGLAALQGHGEAGTRIDELWLDHDLGYNPDVEFSYDTIMPLVEWLEEQAYHGNVLDIGHVYVHTANYAAAPRMVAALRKHYAISTAELPLAEVQDYPDFL